MIPAPHTTLKRPAPRVLTRIEPAKIPQTKHRPPLGLPNGSVRALLTIMIVAVVIAKTIRGEHVETLWTETLMIALAHYFTSRRFIKLAPDVVRQLESDGAVEPEAHPLFLPRHSIRVILFAAFGGLAVYLFLHDQLLQGQGLATIGVVAPYFLGNIVGIVTHHFSKGHQTPAIRGWEDVKAIAVLAVLGFTAAAFLMGQAELVPHLVRNSALGLVLFYFGSR